MANSIDRSLEVEKFEKAIRRNDETSLRVLISNNSKLLNSITARGFSMLHVAVENSTYEIVELLLNEGADINIQNETKDSLLHVAAGSASATKELVELLIQRGLSVNACERTCETPLHKACVRSLNCVEIAEVFIKHGADINSSGFYRTPLQIAVIMENMPLVYLLLEQANIDIDKLSTDLDDGNTALHHACMVNNIDIVEILLQAGANKNIYNNLHQLPIDLTTNEDIKLLLRSSTFTNFGTEKNELANVKRQLENLRKELSEAKHEIEYLRSTNGEGKPERLQASQFSDCKRFCIFLVFGRQLSKIFVLH